MNREQKSRLNKALRRRAQTEQNSSSGHALSIREKFLFLFTLINFLIGLSGFYYTYIKFNRESVDSEPNLVMRMVLPAENERFGFYFSNIGDRPVILHWMNLKYADGFTAEMSDALAQKANIDNIEYSRVPESISYSIGKNSDFPYYVFKKKMNSEEFEAWHAYAVTLGSEYCYCTLDEMKCWQKTFGWRDNSPRKKVNSCQSKALP